MGSEVKPAKLGLRRHLNAGFFAGFLLVLLTYVIVSQQFAMETPTGNLTIITYSSIARSFFLCTKIILFCCCRRRSSSFCP
jgi:hypothetical protein